MSSYEYRHYPYVRPAELDAPGPRRPVVIVGAGIAGPTLALSLATRGVPALILDDDDTVSLGSRSICQAKHSLETWDRFGIAARMVEKGITWEQGEVYLRDRAIYRFNLQPEPGHKFPAFVNLQQYYVEEYLYERCRAEALIEMRHRNKVIGVAPRDDGVTLTVDTPDGSYTLETDWLVACDGVRSPVRHMLGLPYPGEVFHDQFLIADIRLTGDLPKERRFWFYPPFHPTNSVLLHRQADDILRVDFQLGRDADPDEEKKPENIDRRLRQMFGPEARWEHEWSSVYTFTCRMMERFLHGRTIFAGDAAHVVSPFGARGGNAAVADADNLAWKLARVREGRVAARPARQLLRGAPRRVAREHPAIDPQHGLHHAQVRGVAPLPRRHLVPGARLSLRPVLDQQRAAVGADGAFRIAPRHAGCRLRRLVGWPGARSRLGRCPAGQWLAGREDRSDFTLLSFGDAGKAPPGVTVLPVECSGLAAARYDAQPGTTYLIRPDRYVAARWRRHDPGAVQAALARATGR